MIPLSDMGIIRDSYRRVIEKKLGEIKELVVYILLNFILLYLNILIIKHCLITYLTMILTYTYESKLNFHI